MNAYSPSYHSNNASKWNIDWYTWHNARKLDERGEDGRDRNRDVDFCKIMTKHYLSYIYNIPDIHKGCILFLSNYPASPSFRSGLIRKNTTMSVMKDNEETVINTVWLDISIIQLNSGGPKATPRKRRLL